MGGGVVGGIEVARLSCTPTGERQEGGGGIQLLISSAGRVSLGARGPLNTRPVSGRGKARKKNASPAYGGGFGESSEEKQMTPDAYSTGLRACKGDVGNLQ